MQNGGKATVIYTSIMPEKKDTVKSETIIKIRSKPNKVGYAERLLRNTAIACALLLGILTLKNIDAPWTQTAISGIETALTMRIDPDETLGDLSFVRSIIPESTLVFFNMSSSGILEPVGGKVIHEYISGQPWTLFSAEEGENVRCALAGTVSAVSCMESGDWCVLVDHGEGIETVYAYLEKPTVDAGDKLARGGSIGNIRGNRLYFEYRVNGESKPPFGDNGR